MYWCATNKARRTWQMAMREPPAKLAWHLLHPALAQPTWSQVLPPPSWIHSHGLHHRPGASWFIGYDAFQETDVTGVTLPITKHNYLVTSVEDINATVREAFYVARSGRPGPVLIDITKDAQMNEIDWEYDDTPIKMSGYRPDFSPVEGDLQQAAEMIAQAERPLILAAQAYCKVAPCRN